MSTMYVQYKYMTRDKSTSMDSYKGSWFILLEIKWIDYKARSMSMQMHHHDPPNYWMVWDPPEQEL